MQGVCLYVCVCIYIKINIYNGILVCVCVCVCDAILLSREKSKLMPFAATWIQPEIIILSEGWRKLERERRIPDDLTYMRKLKLGTNEPVYKTERDSQA